MKKSIRVIKKMNPQDTVKNNDDVNCLLIWPPLIIENTIMPLSIPSLLAYLKKHHINTTEVFDANSFYKQLGLFGLLFRIHKGYKSFVRRIYKRPNLKAKLPFNIYVNDNIGKRGQPKNLNKQRLFSQFIVDYKRFTERMFLKLISYIVRRELGIREWSFSSMMQYVFETPLNNKNIEKKSWAILKSISHINKFRLIGISVVYPAQLLFALVIAKELKRKYGEEIYIVLGGPQISEHVNMLIQNQHIYQCVDFLVCNDGEEALLEIIRRVNRKDFAGIPNTYHKDSSMTSYRKYEKIFHMNPECFLVPDFSGFDLCQYTNDIPILVSRGCFWGRCNFCTYPLLYNCRYCIASIDRTVGILNELKKNYGAHSYFFVDDALPPQFMRKLAIELIKSGLNIKWGCSIILDNEFADHDFCYTLAKSGLSHVSIGFESACSRILELMNKKHKSMNKNEIKEILVMLKKVNVHIGLHIIIGFPTETSLEAQETLDFLIENKDLYDVAWPQPFVLEEGTPIFKDFKHFSIIRIYREDKNYGERLGYSYDTVSSLNDKELVYSNAVKTLREINKIEIKLGFYTLFLNR